MDMDLRSSRSRSRTPYVQITKMDQDVKVSRKNHVIEKENVVQHSYSTRNKTQKVTSTSSDEVFSSSVLINKHDDKSVGRSRQRHKTSDYSSEDGENENASIRTENMSSRSQLSAERIIKNGEIKSPLEVYKAAGEYWNIFPKTDYTYSVHSKDRTELAPGVILMPNMSRRSLRRSMEPSPPLNHEQLQQQQQQQQEETSTYYSGSSSKYSRINNKHDYRSNVEHRKALFRDEINEESFFKRRITTMTKKIFKSIVTVMMIVYNTAIFSMLWFARAYYNTVSRLFLFDTWLMQKSSGTSNDYKRFRALIALILLPLLLFAGWWLWSSTRETYQEPSPVPIIDSPHLDEHLSKLILASKDGGDTYNVNNLIEMLLANPELEKIIVKHINSRTKNFDEQQQSVDALKSEMKLVNKKVDNVHSNLKLEIARNHAKLTMELNRCCKRQFIHIETYVKKLLGDLMGIPNANLQSEDISNWLNTIFVAKQDLETRLNNITQYLHSDLEDLVEISAAKIMNEVTNKINFKLKQHFEFNKNSNVGGGSALSDSQVHRIVKEALAVYDADKTGLVDYALESSGGQILSTRCTENYHSRTAVVSVLGVPLWYPSNTPRIVITPGVTPGECWAFQNFPGFLVIELSTYVKISAFSLEHIPKSLSPGGHRDSAPKCFEVFGLKSEKDNHPLLIGSYEYDLEGPALQFFTVENEIPAFNMVELRIESNHGNLNYTCLYRFRVHGNISNEPT